MERIFQLDTKRMFTYTLVSVLHSGKTVVRELPNFKEVKQELDRQKQLKAFYRESLWQTRKGNFKKIQYAR